MAEDEKKIDMGWKASVEKEKGEKDAPTETHGAVDNIPEVTFGLFISGLMMEALVALGDMENPITKKKEQSLPQAKFIIETMAMLKAKTKNNLTKDESEALEAILYDLRMRFVGKAGGKKA